LKVLKTVFDGKTPETVEFEYKKKDGTISIDSNLGKGTTVTISLPLNLE